MNNKVLLVDDEKFVLSAYRRQLGSRFDISTAQSGEEGLRVIKSDGPFSVIVSDYKMPNMDGIDFLSRARDITPDTTRIMLTGNADMDTAITAVNKGQIFRFLAKPYPSDQLALIIDAGIGQHRLITAEKILLEKTLKGAIAVLAEVLGLVNPIAFSKAGRVRNIINQIVAQLKIANGWQYEVAALLSQIGCVIVPSETLEKVNAGTPLSTAEQDIFDTHPDVATSLLSNIPRMETVAKIINAQNSEYKIDNTTDNINTVNRIALGGHLLHVATVIDNMQKSGTDQAQVLKRLKSEGKSFDPRIIAAIEKIHLSAPRKMLKNVKAAELSSEMMLDEDVFTDTGVLLASKGQDVNMLLLGRLKVFARGVGVREPIRVIVESTRSSPIP